MYILVFRWHDQYKKSRSKQNQDWSKSIQIFFIYHIVYVTVRNLSYRTDNSLNPSYLIINKIDRYIEKSNVIKYLTLAPTDEGRAD